MRGATLVEMLVAVAIFAFVISGTFLLFQSFSRMYSRGISQSEIRERLRLIGRILAKDVSTMYGNCVGTVEEISFFSSRVRGGDFSLSEVHYWIDNGKIYRAEERISDGDFSARGESEVLVDKVERGQFSYLCDGRWQGLSCSENLPEMVSLDVKFVNNKKQYRFEFKVMIRGSDGNEGEERF